MTTKVTIKAHVTNPDTDETVDVLIEAWWWFYPATMEDPEESTWDFIRGIGAPEWATDEMLEYAMHDNGEMIDDQRNDN